MNTTIPEGSLHGVRYYRSENGRHTFAFEFARKGSHVEINCRRHPGFNGQDPDPHKTHLFHSGKLCFHAGREPRTQSRAEQLAKAWAEYFLDYRRTGRAKH